MPFAAMTASKPDLEVADRLVDVHELVQAEQADAERVVVVARRGRAARRPRSGTARS